MRAEIEREPRPKPVDGLLWRRDEAVIAPGCFFDLSADPEITQPVWLPM